MPAPRHSDDLPTPGSISSATPRFRFSLRWWLLVATLGLLALAITAFYGLPRIMPLPPSLREARDTTSPPSVSLAQTVGEAHHPPSPERPPVLSYAQLPQSFVTAMIATQDSDFWNHGGTGTGRAVDAIADSFRRGRFVPAGSTITEQLAKISAARDTPRSVKSRLVDALTARRIELSFSKERILEEYCARLPFGNGFTGLDAAAEGYFGKAPAALSLAESAFLAGLPDAPSQLNPHRHLEAAKAKQQAILDRLAASGQISPQEASQAVAEPIRLRPAP